MTDFLLALVRAQLAASAAILVVLVVRRLVRRLVGARIAYALWLLPLVGAVAILLPPRIDYAVRPAVAAAALETAPFVQDHTAPIRPAAYVAAPAPDAPVGIDPALGAVGLWGFGVLASLGWLAIQQGRYLGFARRGAAGPAVIGFWRPRMVLPLDFEDCYSGPERALIIAHEAAHLRRNDARIIGLALVLRSLGWFNPLVYIAVNRLRIDQELACDETVVSAFPSARRAYAAALAKSQLAVRPLPLGCYWPAASEHPLLERIAMLKITHIAASARMAGIATLVVLCAVTGVTAWASTPAQIRYVSRELERAVLSGPARAAAASLPPTPQTSRARPAGPRAPAIADPPMTPQDPDSALMGALASGDARGIVMAGGAAEDVLNAILNNGQMDDMGEPMGEPFKVSTDRPVEFTKRADGTLGIAFEATMPDGSHVLTVLSPPEISDLGRPAGEHLAQLAEASRPRPPNSGPGP